MAIGAGLSPAPTNAQLGITNCVEAERVLLGRFYFCIVSTARRVVQGILC